MFLYIDAVVVVAVWFPSFFSVQQVLFSLFFSWRFFIRFFVDRFTHLYLDLDLGIFYYFVRANMRISRLCGVRAYRTETETRVI